MSDHEDNNQTDNQQEQNNHHQDEHHNNEDHQENSIHSHGISDIQQQRLHRLVLPLILDLLRSRNRGGASRERTASANSSMREEEGTNVTLSPPSQTATQDAEMDDGGWFLPEENESASTNNVDDAQRHAHEEDAHPPDDLMEDVQPPQRTNQQGQLIESPSSSYPSSSSPFASRRSRYRLVVYFEDRDAMTGGGDPDTHEASSPPSRYVAIFSIDSDSHNMPVIQSADFQQSSGSIDEILNQLFTAHCPKGTPPAKKEIIDTLPTTKYTSGFSSQPKCAVCLEDFEEGMEMVELPCSHRFHGESCVKHWLRIHSSCPVCRYEMPVDDTEYEEKRKARVIDAQPNNALENAQTTNNDDAIL